jgi:endoribonuclease Dicer
MNAVVDKGRDVADIEDNGEKYRLVSAPAVPKRVSERKRTDAAIFEAWLKTKEKSQAFKKQRIEVRERVGRVKSKMTTASLVRQSQSRRIVDSPREYQIELFERAKEKNTIIVLDTGNDSPSPDLLS